MSSAEEWWRAYQHELERAYSARDVGNEGMARVCARRAAGIAAGEYLERIGVASESRSAYQRLLILRRQPGLPGRVLAIIEDMITRVDFDHRLPAQIDLLVEAEEFHRILLGEGGESSVARLGGGG